MKPLNEVALGRWQQLVKDSYADSPSWTQYQRENEQRKTICKEMGDLLSSFLRGEVETDALRETFDRKTRKEWDAFGFKGMSGAMFLNKLVKHVPNADSLSSQLRSVLALPKDPEDGRVQMRTFLEFLLALIEAGEVTKAQVQPARVLFFISAWWHIQNTEQWPVYYGSGRAVLQQQPDYETTDDLIGDYFAFRDYFLTLASRLGVDSWTLEHLLDWQNRFGGKTDPPTPKPEIIEIQEDKGEVDVPGHTQIQWLLAKIGRRLGCKVWIAANDQGREWDGQKLGDFCIPSLPTLGLDDASQKIIRLIDVVWLKGVNQVVAAFEIEQTTSIFSGLLRMSDLGVLSPNLNFPFYLIAPERRLSQVRAQLSRPTFQFLELHKRCGYFSCELLHEHAESILRWATSPVAIEQLAAKVEDTPDKCNE